MGWGARDRGEGESGDVKTKLASTDGFSGDAWLGTDVETANDGGRRGMRRTLEKPGRLVLTKPGAPRTGLAGGTARGQPAVDAGARRRHGEKQRRERRDGGDGNFVINSKFQNSGL